MMANSQQLRCHTKEYGSSWIFEPCLTWANVLRRVQRSVFSLVTGSCGALGGRARDHSSTPPGSASRAIVHRRGRRHWHAGHHQLHRLGALHRPPPTRSTTASRARGSSTSPGPRSLAGPRRMTEAAHNPVSGNPASAESARRQTPARGRCHSTGGVGGPDPGRRPVAVALPPSPPTLSPAAATVLLRILTNAAKRQEANADPDGSPVPVQSTTSEG